MNSSIRRFAMMLAGLGIAISGCAAKNIDPRYTRIDARIASPDGKLEAVYAEDTGGGAAIGVTEEVFVVTAGKFPALEDRVLSEECVHDIKLAWMAPRLLNVSYVISADFRDHPHPYGPSLLSMLSSGYWTFSHPHGVRVRFLRQLVQPQGVC